MFAMINSIIDTDHILTPFATDFRREGTRIYILVHIFGVRVATIRKS